MREVGEEENRSGLPIESTSPVPCLRVTFCLNSPHTRRKVFTMSGTETDFRITNLPFRGPWLLAPMEGITDPSFRDIMLGEFRSSSLGGAFTEFVRISAAPVQPHVIERHLGARRFPSPVGLQLMGSDVDHVAASARIAARAGAPLVDLNFGCPSRGARQGCVGSSLLAFPDRMEALVAACVRAVEGLVPVSAKIRAGVSSDKDVEVLARAVENGGASMLTIHCRTRDEAYCDVVDWDRIGRAVSAVSIPVCGNGGILEHRDLERMRQHTGCALVMVGRAALRDPWVFSGRSVTATEAAKFLLRYVASMRERVPGAELGMLGRMKQILRFWHAGGLAVADRSEWLSVAEPAMMVQKLERVAAGVPA